LVGLTELAPPEIPPYNDALCGTGGTFITRPCGLLDQDQAAWYSTFLADRARTGRHNGFELVKSASLSTPRYELHDKQARQYGSHPRPCTCSPIKTSRSRKTPTQCSTIKLAPWTQLSSHFLVSLFLLTSVPGSLLNLLTATSIRLWAHDLKANVSVLLPYLPLEIILIEPV